jgi:hypothetical protein
VPLDGQTFLIDRGWCHQDLHPRNAFIRGAGGTEQTVAIDWAFCGRAPLDAYLAPCSGPHWPPSSAIATTQTNGNGFAWTPTSTVCDSPADRAIVTTSSLATWPQSSYGSWSGTAGPVLTLALDNSLDAMVEQIFGRPKPELIARLRKIYEFFCSRLCCNTPMAEPRTRAG